MKSMKKSMFLTTILMVVLLIVALSTATFAWYTANTAVGATKTTVTSATSATASLVIDNQKATSANATNSSVDLTMTGTNVPMVYTDASAVAAGTNTYADFITKFYTFTRTNAGYFTGTPSNIAPGTISAVSGTGSSAFIVLTNVGGQSLATLTTTVTIDPYYFYTEFATTAGVTSVEGKYTYAAGVYSPATGTAVAETTYYTRSAAQDHLRVAVFAGASASDSALYLKGIYGAGTAQRAAAALTSATTSDLIETTVGSNSLNTDLSTAFKASGADLEIATSVASMTAVYVKVVVWFEGVDMNNIDAGQTAAFTMAFAG